MQYTHVIVIPDADPGAASVYSNESFHLELRVELDGRGNNRFPWPAAARSASGGRERLHEYSQKALDWCCSIERDRTIEGVTFVKAVIR